MHIKHEYNFFSSLENKNTQSKTQLLVIISAGAVIIAAAILLFLLGKASLANDERVLADVRARVTNPEVLTLIAELDVRQAQLDSLEQYKQLAQDILKRVEDANYVSIENMDALVAELPASVQVESVNIQGLIWQLECKTDTFSDVALLLNNLETSDTFQNILVGSVQTTETGLYQFPLSIQLEGGVEDEAE